MSIVSPSVRGVLLTAPPWVRDAFWRVAQQVPALDLDFRSQSIVDRIGGIVPTFTRPSVKLMWDGSVYREYAVDEPAFQKAADGTWEYLPEPAATNLWTRSHDLTNAEWNRGAGATYANVGEIAAGANILQITENLASSTRGVSQAYVFTAGVQVTASIFVRKGTTTADSAIVSLGTASGQFAAPCNGIVNLTTGAVSSINNCVVEATAYGPWWRISISATPLLTATSVSVCNLIKGGVQAYAGDGAGTAFMALPQLETGPIATSPIITAGSTVTRAADLMTVTGLQFSDWYDQAGGTVYFEGTPYDTTAGLNFGMYSISSGTFDNGITAFLGSGTANVLTIRDAGASQAYITDQPQAVLGQRQKLASSIAVNNVLHSVNGASPTLDNVATVPTGLNQLHIGRAATVITRGNIGIRRLSYFPPGSSQNRVQQLSGATLPDPYANAPWLPLQADPLWVTANQIPAFDLDFTSGTPVNRGSLAAGNLGTFSRPSSIKLVWDGTQYVSVAADTPALQLDPVSGLWGVLMERAATNLNLDAVDFSALSRAGLLDPVLDSETTPVIQGTPTQLYTEATGTTNHQINLQQFPVVAGSTYTATCIFKPYLTSGSLRRFNVVISGGEAGWPSNQNWTFRPSTETFSATSGTAQEWRKLQNGYYEIKVTTVAAPNTGGTNIAIRFVKDSNSQLTYEGVSDTGFHIAYLGVEAGPIATSPIITAGSAVTRNADLWVFDGVDFSDWYDQAGGVIRCVTSGAVVDGSPHYTLSDGTALNRIGTANGSPVSPQTRVVSGGVEQHSHTFSGGMTPGALASIAFRALVNNFDAGLNGLLGTADLSGALPAVDRITLASNVAGSAVRPIIIHRFTYFPPGPAQDRIQQLSAL